MRETHIRMHSTHTQTLASTRQNLGGTNGTTKTIIIFNLNNIQRNKPSSWKANMCSDYEIRVRKWSEQCADVKWREKDRESKSIEEGSKCSSCFWAMGPMWKSVDVNPFNKLHIVLSYFVRLFLSLTRHTFSAFQSRCNRIWLISFFLSFRSPVTYITPHSCE